jgi:hypothetical protein
METAIRSLFSKILRPGDAKSKTANEAELELELRFINLPMSYERGKIIAHPKLLSESDVYIEYVMKKAASVNANKKDIEYPSLKYRQRIPIDNLYGLEVRKKNLRDMLGKQWTKKISIQTVEDGNLQLNIASEETENISMTNSHHANTSIYVVQRDKYRSGNWLIEFKTKYQLVDDNKTIVDILSGKYLPDVYVEIEYTKDYSLWSDSDLDSLFGNVLRQLFFVQDLSQISLKTKLTNFKARINIEDHRTLLEDETTVNTMFIRYKVDGVTCKFINHNNICEVYVVDRTYAYIFNSDISNKLEGEGEYTEDRSSVGIKRTIYPYIVVVDDKEVPRLEGLIMFENLTRTDSESSQIHFGVVEHRGPFVSREERCYELLNMIDNVGHQEFKCDGYVFVDSTSMPYTEILDYKFKYDITIDLMAVILIKDSNIVTKREIQSNKEQIAKIRESEYSDASTPAINISLLVSDAKSVGLYKTISIPANIKNLFHFISRRMNFTSEMDEISFSHGFKVIVEYSLNTNSIVKIRLDKTNRALTSLYYGNDLQIVKKHEKVLSTLWSTDLIRQMSEKFESGYIRTIIREEDEDDGLIRLNKGQDYFLKDKGRNILGIVTNEVKSLLISAIGSVVLGNKRDNILMIDGGQGGDLSKYYYVGARFLVLTDPLQVNLDEALSRYNTMATKNIKNNKGRPFTFHTLRKEIIQPNYYTSVKSIIGTPFDIIDMNLSIHYSWGPHVKNILDNIYMLSKVGTRMLITTLNGSKLKPILEKELTYVLKYDYDQECIFNYIDDTKYSVYLTKVMAKPMEEYYVHSSDLKSKMYSIGFELFDEVDSFAEQLMRTKPFYNDEYYTLEIQHALKGIFANMAPIILKFEYTSDLYKLLDLYVGYIFRRKV